ncbi:RDH16 dehydrogenase, partial [Semnornis frantzii]|nr:RDH16 dehydrogenase [Semnornis frantzii]
RIEMQHFGVRISIIEPGFFRTAITSTDTHKRQLLSCWDRLTQEAKAAYGDRYLQGIHNALNMVENSFSPTLQLVTDCMEHALTSCHPRARYSAGWDAKLIYIPLSYLPSAFTDLF